MMDPIGDRIKRLRQEKGLSLSELAERANVAKSHLSNVERSIKNNPSLQFLEKIAAALGLPLESLLETHSPESGDGMDAEWRQLVQEAMASGISKDQFRDFLSLMQKWKGGDRP